MATDPHAYADEGTIAHTLAAMCLTEHKPASAYIGRLIKGEDYEHAKLSPSTAHRWMRCPGSHALETRAPFKPRTYSRQVDEEMARGVQKYVDHIEDLVRKRDAMLLVEQRVPVGHITTEEGAEGQADAIVLDFAGFELSVTDLKFGAGVEIEATDNEQLMLYLLGAIDKLAEFEPEGGWQRFRGAIFQPRINDEPSEEMWSREELHKFRVLARGSAMKAIEIKNSMDGRLRGHKAAEQIEEHLVPGEKQCRFCSVKATCPALRKHVNEMVSVELGSTEPGKAVELAAIPADETRLARLKRWTPLLRAWCDAVDAHTEAIMLAGHKVPGFKLVTGRKGNRAWTSEEEAEKALKSMRLKNEQMYNMKLISPTQAEKLVDSKALGERQWHKLEKLVAQSPGKPTVVPEDDKRPALDVKPVAHELGAPGPDLPALPAPEEDDLV